jgi:hypothetical protein
MSNYVVTGALTAVFGTTPCEECSRPTRVERQQHGLLPMYRYECEKCKKHGPFCDEPRDALIAFDNTRREIKITMLKTEEETEESTILQEVQNASVHYRGRSFDVAYVWNIVRVMLIRYGNKKIRWSS